jgi:hypothetical protein
MQVMVVGVLEIQIWCSVWREWLFSIIHGVMAESSLHRNLFVLYLLRQSGWNKCISAGRSSQYVSGPRPFCPVFRWNSVLMAYTTSFSFSSRMYNRSSILGWDVSYLRFFFNGYRRYSGLSVKLKTFLCLVLTLRIHGVLPQLHGISAWHGAYIPYVIKWQFHYSL